MAWSPCAASSWDWVTKRLPEGLRRPGRRREGRARPGPRRAGPPAQVRPDEQRSHGGWRRAEFLAVKVGAARSAPRRSRSRRRGPPSTVARASSLASPSRAPMASRRPVTSATSNSSAGSPASASTLEARPAAPRASGGQSPAPVPRQVPGQLVELPHHPKTSNTRSADAAGLPPVHARQRRLDDMLPGAEAVVGDAAGHARRPQPLVDPAAQVSGTRCRQATPAGLSKAKSAEAAKPGATQHRPGSGRSPRAARDRHDRRAPIRQTDHAPRCGRSDGSPGRASRSSARRSPASA